MRQPAMIVLVCDRKTRFSSCLLSKVASALRCVLLCLVISGIPLGSASVAQETENPLEATQADFQAMTAAADLVFIGSVRDLKDVAKDGRVTLVDKSLVEQVATVSVRAILKGQDPRKEFSFRYHRVAKYREIDPEMKTWDKMKEFWGETVSPDMPVILINGAKLIQWAPAKDPKTAHLYPEDLYLFFAKRRKDDDYEPVTPRDFEANAVQRLIDTQFGRVP